MAEQIDDTPTATLVPGDANWHDGPGWYYVIDDLPDEGSCGAFADTHAAILHAARDGYIIEHKVHPDLISPDGGVTEVWESPTSCRTGIVVSRIVRHVGCHGRTPCECLPMKTIHILYHRHPSATFDPAERAREKQASRDEDARALASGEKTVEQLRRENSAFAFPRDRVRLTRPKKEG